MKWNYKKYSKNIAKGKSGADADYQAMLQEIGGVLKELSYTQAAYVLTGMTNDENMFADEEMTGLGKRVLSLVREICKREASDLLTLAPEALALREELKDHMDCLMTYVDRFSIYSRVLQNMYYQFNPMPEMPDLSDEEQADQIVGYLQAEKDQTMLKMKMMDILKALPVRMTKNKFYDLVADGLTVYTDSDQTAVEDFLYQVRNASGLYEPAHFTEYFSEIHGYLERFAGIRYGEVTEEAYDGLCHTMRECNAYIGMVIESYNSLASLTNELTSICLMSRYPEVKEEHVAHAKQILSEISASFDFEDVQDFIPTLLPSLEALEGVQEPLSWELYEMSAAIETVMDSAYAKGLLPEAQQELWCLRDVCDMLSSNNFSKLGEKPEPQPADRVYIMKCAAALKKEWEALFAGKEKALVRSIMAAVIGYLPSHFSNIHDLRRHISDSLRGCTNEAEKLACLEQIEAIMCDEDYDLFEDEMETEDDFDEAFDD